jgi:hypothetical protein
MSTSQIQEAVLAERERCASIVEGIRDGLMRDANQPALDGDSLTRTKFLEAADVANVIAKALRKDIP